MLSKVMQNEYLLLKVDFQSGNFVLNDFWKQNMYFLTLDKKFNLGQFQFCPEQKIFCPSRRTRHKSSLNSQTFWKLFFLLSKVMQNEYLLLKIDFESGNFVLNDFWKQKMYLINPGQNFYLRQFQFCPGQNWNCPR